MPTLWIKEAGGLVSLESNGYATEHEFQSLLAMNPEILASAIDPSLTGNSWLLVDRELDIRAEDEGDTVTWRLDHLFLASDGMPVLVEVKRSSDPRARREVVAQMLDYAASFALDWSATRLRGRLDLRLESEALSREAEIGRFLANSSFEDELEFWQAVDTKIAAGQIRLLFVADRLSSTLVRIIEYLNAQLHTAEVLGVEVACHSTGDASIVAYQPVVRGRTTSVPSRKLPKERRTRPEFEAVLKARHGQTVLKAVTDLVARAEALGSFVTIGTNKKSPRLFLNFHTPCGSDMWPIGINPGPGKLVLFLRNLKTHPAFADEAVRGELVAGMERATGLAILGDNLGGFPYFPVEVLIQDGVVDSILDVLRWTIAEASAVPLSLPDGATPGADNSTL